MVGDSVPRSISGKGLGLRSQDGDEDTQVQGVDVG